MYWTEFTESNSVNIYINQLSMYFPFFGRLGGKYICKWLNFQQLFFFLTNCDKCWWSLLFLLLISSKFLNASVCRVSKQFWFQYTIKEEKNVKNVKKRILNTCENTIFLSILPLCLNTIQNTASNYVYQKSVFPCRSSNPIAHNLSWGSRQYKENSSKDIFLSSISSEI